MDWIMGRPIPYAQPRRSVMARIPGGRSRGALALQADCCQIARQSAVVVFMTSSPELTEIRQFPAPLRSVVVARLRSAIISGSLKPGDRLIEARLAKMLKISRPSLREAMRQIEAEGLVEIVPNVGPIVRKPTLDEVRDIHDMREVMEGLCARYFAIRGTDAAIDRLERMADMIQAALATADVGEIKRAKQAYYEAFTAGCGSELVRRYVLQLVAMTSYSWGSSLNHPGRPLAGLH